MSEAVNDSVPTDGVIDWRGYPPLELPRILQVALEEIVQHGYDATSVRSISREVGVTIPVLYYHYENKQGLLKALLDHAMTIVITHVNAALAEAGTEPANRLGAAVEAIALYMANHSDLAFLDSERRSLTPENLQEYLAHRDWIDQVLRDAIEDGCRSGVFATPYPDAARRAVLTMCQGIASWYRPDGGKSPEDTAHEFVRLALATVEFSSPD